MPVWHEQVKDLVESGQLVVLGITQEQHPERCRLYKQWRQFNWPIVHDPLNLMGSRAVPLFVLIDEHGVVRSTRANPRTFRQDFLEKSFDKPSASSSEQVNAAAEMAELRSAAQQHGRFQDWMKLGDAIVLWQPDRPGDAIAAYREARKLQANSGEAWFRSGVAYRMRYESANAEPDDFQKAVAHWTQALEIDPNQYIWRRRIQQYGPRLDKPYPFYDWVEQARREIQARGETPIELPVPLSGAEVAQRLREFTESDQQANEPDPQGRIERDLLLIQPRITVVPARVKPGGSVRVHIELTPIQQAHWNNEAEPLALWIPMSMEYRLDQQLLQFQGPAKPESRETRRLEFEVQVAADATTDIEIPAYALFNVCEDIGGQCLYRRKDFNVRIPIHTTTTK